MNLPGVYKTFLDKWSSLGLQSCWIISDTHFSNQDLKAGIEKRPIDEDFVKNINAKCGKRDLLIHLGDVGDIFYIRKIKAKYKILIMGNHDSGRTNYEHHIYEESFPINEYSKEEALSAMKEKYPNCRYMIEEHYKFHDRFTYWTIYADNQLFDEIFEGPLIIGEKLILSHEPVDVPWAFNIHGHIHDSKHKNDKRHLNVCADVIGYTPINMNQFMKSGALAHVETIHRAVIDKARVRKQKRGGKKIRG